MFNFAVNLSPSDSCLVTLIYVDILSNVADSLNQLF